MSIFFISFIGDYNRRTWIYFLKSKTQVFSLFKEFKALVENQTSKKIKCVRTDNGGEFFSVEFEKLFKNKVSRGVKQLLIPHIKMEL